MSQTSRIVDSLKQILKTKGFSYKDLAEKLDLSEASVKRLFSEHTFALSRIEEICDILEIDLLQLTQSAFRKKSSNGAMLSIEQESELASDRNLFVYFYLLQQGWKPKDIAQAYKFTATEAERLLILLDKFQLIDLYPKNVVKRKFDGHIQWREKGPVRQLFEQMASEEFLATSASGDGSGIFFVSGEMSTYSHRVISNKIQKLIDDMTELCEIDANLPKHETKSYGFLISFRPWIFSIFADAQRALKNK